MSEEGKKRLRDLASKVREKLNPAGEPLLNQRGLALVDELAKELTAPDAMPGLHLFRDSPQRFRLQRERKNAEIAFEWQRDIGAAVMTCTSLGQVKKLERYVLDEASSSQQGAWRRMSGLAGDPFDDVSDALIELLYPEAR